MDTEIQGLREQLVLRVQEGVYNSRRVYRRACTTRAACTGGLVQLVLHMQDCVYRTACTTRAACLGLLVLLVLRVLPI